MSTLPEDLLSIGYGKMLTGSGRIFDLYNPTMDMVDIEDIANALGKQCRWNGNIPEFFSVAQHSVMVSWLAPNHLAYAALMHDAAEAYIGDIISPIKIMLADFFKKIEHRIELVIFNKFGIAPDLLELVNKYDIQARKLEYAAFFKNDELAQKKIRHLSSIRLAHTPMHYCWDAELAKYNFLFNYASLCKDRKRKDSWVSAIG